MTVTMALGFALARSRPANRARVEAALVMTGLGAIVLARAAATRAGVEPVTVGAAFGLALLALALAGGIGARVGGVAARVGQHMVLPMVIGASVGFGFVLAAGAGATPAGAPHLPGLARPAGSFLPWAAVTLVVAIAEEMILRGLLFSRLQHAGGNVLAVLATTAAFALMHVPLYGWHVVPLDVAVGLGLGGLRIATRGIAAPAAAHAVADIATWWL